MLNKYDTLNSTVERLGCEVIVLKERKMGSAVSTVAASSGSCGSASNFVAPVISGMFGPSRVELKGWVFWRNIRGIGITVDEAKTLVVQIKTRIPNADLGNFNWDLTVRDQGISSST